MQESDKQLILQKLQQDGLLTHEKIAALFEESKKTGIDVLHVLQANHIVDEEILTQYTASIIGVPYVNLVTQEISSDVLHVLSRETAENYHIVPWKREGDQVCIGLINPHDYKAVEALDFIARKQHLQFVYYLISPSSLTVVLRKYADLNKEVAEALKNQTEDVVLDALDDQTEEDMASTEIKNAPVSKMVAVILRYAVEGKASDVHIEPTGNVTRVRYRVDGILHTSIQLPGGVHNSLVARIKVLANLKLDETRLPQDGRFRMKIEGREIDFRVSTLPLIGHEKVVLRILDKNSGILSLEDLGFMDRNFAVMKNHLDRPHGMILITGPTGSGKSTTLYAMLQILNQEERNIITLEDPVEYEMPGIAQSQIRPEIGLTFARGLRSILRQDPDIIMVGEIRDNETAELGVHAALTGHMLLSTLHTNDAIGAIPRLIDMKIEPFLISSALNVIVAQRLVRKNCEECVQETPVPQNLADSILAELRNIPQESVPQDIAHLITASQQQVQQLTTRKGQGCSRCEDTGYKGRIAIAEVVEVTTNLQEIIASGNSNKPSLLMQELKAQGMISLKQDGLIKALRGHTSIEEALTIAAE
ncbi:MAG TPA: GspE/PulE family protein [Patescibacteria group bacterium]|nr:GspE/PulE family protein [Patescibacteria group bacterium]